MLRIRYAGRETVFEYRGIKKRDVPDVLRHHLSGWGREQVKDADGNHVVRVIPPNEMIPEWMEGDVWNDANPIETLPVPQMV